MSYDRFMIAPVNTGLETDLKPWLIPDDAYARLNNVYVFRGRLRKRFGSSYTGSGAAAGLEQLNSRLRIPLTGGAGVGITDGAGTANGTAPGAIFKVGQMFSIGTEVFTVNALGVPGVMITNGAATTHTFNTTTGAYAFVNSIPGTQIYFYPSEPVMGLTRYQSGTINNQPTYAFDTQFTYVYAGGSWNRSIVGVPIWHGDNADFFWVCNWEGLTANSTSMFVSNFQVTNYNGAVVAATDDPLWTYNTATGWAVFTPRFLTAGAGNTVKTARIIVAFKDRLILLNTVELDAAGTANLNYTSRCRYSHNGSPLAGSAWLEPNQVGFTGGGWIDAATEEQIISAAFIKDRLIVYFERSTWELAYTGNQVQPFIWQMINTGLGSQATFSSVEFDKMILTVGNTGIHSCTGANVARIDDKIPDEVFQIRNKNAGVTRVAGIRDYYTEMVYWTFPTSNQQPYAETYPSRVLVYNYKNDSWAFNDDCFTCFGYFEQQLDRTWLSTPIPWQNLAGVTWGSGVSQAQFRQIIAGNQQGFVVVLDPTYLNTNGHSLQITDIISTGGYATLTIVDHTLNNGDFIDISSVQGIVLDGIYQVTQVIDASTVVINHLYAAGYTGGGTVARVSRIDIMSKRWNPYVEKARNCFLAKVDFAVKRTTNGQLTVDYYPSSSNISLHDAAVTTGCALGDNVLETNPYPAMPMESSQDLLWHPVYFMGEGQFIQLRIYTDDGQMIDRNIVDSGFELEGLVLYTQMTSTRLQ